MPSHIPAAMMRNMRYDEDHPLVLGNPGDDVEPVLCRTRCTVHGLRAHKELFVRATPEALAEEIDGNLIELVGERAKPKSKTLPQRGARAGSRPAKKAEAKKDTAAKGQPADAGAAPAGDDAAPSPAAEPAGEAPPSGSIDVDVFLDRHARTVTKDIGERVLPVHQQAEAIAAEKAGKARKTVLQALGA